MSKKRKWPKDPTIQELIEMFAEWGMHMQIALVPREKGKEECPPKETGTDKSLEKP